MQAIRTAWSGGTLGSTNSTAERKRKVAEYSIGIVIGFQPSTIGPLFDADQVGGGTPHRFLFFAADDPAIPDNLPEFPGPIVKPEKKSDDMIRDWSSVTYTLDDPEIRAEIKARRLAVARGQALPDDQDRHAVLMRGRIAAHLAGWDGRTEITADDWRLSGAVLAASGAVRAEAVAYGERAARAASAARSAAAVQRARAIREAEAEQDEHRETARVERAAAILARKVHREPGITRKRLRDAAGRHRAIVVDALALAAERGWVVESTDGARGGITYTPGEPVPD